MHLQNHIFNVKRIVEIIKDNRARAKKPEEPNLYEKVNLIFKGAAMGSPELVEEIRAVIAEQCKEAGDFLKEHKKALQGK